MANAAKRSVEKVEFWRLVFDEHAASGLSIRAFCQRGPTGDTRMTGWVETTARRYNLESTLRKPERPRKSPQTYK